MHPVTPPIPIVISFLLVRKHFHPYSFKFKVYRHEIRDSSQHKDYTSTLLHLPLAGTYEVATADATIPGIAINVLRFNLLTA